MKKHISYIAISLAFGILSFIFLIVAITSVAFLIGGNVTPVWPLLSFGLSCAFVYKLLAGRAIRRPLIWTAVLMVIVAICTLFSTATIDPSWDGNSYHKSAVGEMANGWNPVRQDINTFNKSDANDFKLRGLKNLDRAHDTPWINHYPKASWMFAANIYKVTGHIESGKAVTPLTMCALFLLAFGYLYQKFGRNKALIIALLLACNPVTVSQTYSYYVDGLMGNLLIILLLVCTMLLDKKLILPHRRFLLYGVIGISGVLAVNMKFTGLAYVGIILFCYWAYLLLVRQWRMLIDVSIVGVAIVVLGIGIVGASSYIKNMISNGNPLYPLAGKNNLNFIAIEEPAGYEHMSYPSRFIHANLAPTEQINHQLSLERGAPRPKLPFSVSPEETAILSSNDVRQGGYGVWFGGILLVTVGVGVYLLVRYGRRYHAQLPTLLLPIVSIGICVIVVDATWWARYLPQLAIVPIMAVAIMYLRRHELLANVMVFMLFFNVSLTAAISLQSQLELRRTTNLRLTNFTCSDTEPVYVFSSGNLDGALYNLHDKCLRVVSVSPAQFEATPVKDRVELFYGLYQLKS